jgi:glycerate 2-kinase
MMNILIASGAFKHSLTAHEATLAIQRGFMRSGIGATYHLLPIADGGNGTLDAFLATGGTRHTATILDPLARPIHADWGLSADGETAIIEMALASGIELITSAQRDPFIATTYGTGQLMMHALQNGVRRMIIGMGGSATVDGGAGCLMALGVRLLDENGNSIAYGADGLSRIATIDPSGLDPRWRTIEILIATDVDNPTLGAEGAVAVFAPQKGASSDQLPILEAHMTHFFTQVHQQIGMDVRQTKGGGAAGALSAGLMAFLGGKITSGIDLILNHNQFHDHLARADLVITGEGSIDDQTIYGKGPIGVARLAHQAGVPVIAIVGGMNTDDIPLHEAGITAVMPIIPRPMPLETAIQSASALVEQTALRLGYLLQISRKY